MRGWYEVAPFTAYPNVQFLLVSHDNEPYDPLPTAAQNLKRLRVRASTKEEYVDKLYNLHANLVFFPHASRQYFRKSVTKCAGIDYGMEDLYCRDYIAPRPIEDFFAEHTFAFTHYHAIITVSKTSRRDLTWLFPEAKGKLSIVYPSIGQSRYDQQSLKRSALPKPLQQCQYFLVIGYEHKKNILRIAQAFNQFKQKTGSTTKLVLVGKPGYGSHEIDATINRLATSSDILRLGYVSDEQKAAMFTFAHAVVALPIYEGFGLSALEGLYADKVVLVSNNGSLKEVVGNAGFTADPFSVSDIGNKLAYIDQLRSNPRAKAITLQRAKFDLSTQARRLIDVLVAASK